MDANTTKTDELTPAQRAIRDVKTRLASGGSAPTTPTQPVQQVQTQQLQRPSAFQASSSTPNTQAIPQNVPMQSPVVQQPVPQATQPAPVLRPPMQQPIPVQPPSNQLLPVQSTTSFDQPIDINALKAEGISEAEIAALDAELARDLAEDELFIQQQQFPQPAPTQFPPEAPPKQTLGNRINKYFPQYNPDSLDRNSLLVLAVAAIGSIIMYLIIRFVL